VEKAPTESYADVGGLEQQIQEIKEAVELPMTHPELYEDIGIKPPKVRGGVWVCGVCGRGWAGLAPGPGASARLLVLLKRRACRNPDAERYVSGPAAARPRRCNMPLPATSPPAAPEHT
jgi:hypothetical protein